MNGSIEVRTLKPISAMIGEDDEETAQFIELLAKARSFLESTKWCKKILTEYFGAGVADLVGVFLFKILPTSPEIDNILWVIVGDIPSAYLVTDESHNPLEALKKYIDLQRIWIAAIKNGRSVDDLMPVNAAPTMDNALDLERRLDFLEQKILPNIG